MMNEKGEFPFGNWPIPNKPLAFSYDEMSDIMTIEGMKFSGDFFRLMAAQVIIDAPIRVLSNADGVVVIKAIEPHELAGGKNDGAG